jgi:hypothetical protein
MHRMQVTRRVLATALALTLCLEATAFAQPTPAPAPAPDPANDPTTPSKSAVEEARERYERGLRLYEDGAFDAARVEFERAYALAPTYKLLYNIGVVHSQLGDFVGAARTLERYLAEGGDQIPAARRAEMEKLLSELRPRIASVKIVTNVNEADVFVDDIPVGRSPISEPVQINPGRRKVSASKSGFNSVAKSLEVGSSDRVTVNLELTETSRTIVVSEKSRRVPWIGWIATGTLAVGATFTGIFALNSSSDLDEAKKGANADPNKLEDEASKTRTLTIVTDVLAASAVIAGGLSLYYTIKWGKTDESDKAPKDAPKQATQVRVSPGLGGMMLQGTF